MINVYYNYYKDLNEQRNIELSYCLNKLIENKNINNIFILTEIECTLKNKKLAVIKINKRPTYFDFFTIINSKTKENDVNIFLNSDCFLEENDTQYAYKISSEEFWCLTRHDTLSLNPFKYHSFNIHGGNDCWIFKGFVKDLKKMDANFCLGVPSCDFRIAFEVKRVYPIIRNPCSKLRVYHHHPSGVRRYNIEKDELPNNNNWFRLYPNETITKA